MSIFRNTRFCSLVLVLAVLLTLAGGGALKAEGSKLVDLEEASWARQAIAEMAASGVVAGYPGAVYKPYNNVTMLEAVTMLIRMLGLEDQAKAAEEDPVDYRMPSDLYWGRGYLIMAVNLGILDGDYLYLLQPNAPATRTEVAMLAFHALEFEPESGALEFSDADQIPGKYRDGVAAVVKNGIMQGLPGNVFKPNDNINRAQMAVLMSNIVGLKYADPCAERRTNGVISDIDPAGRMIKIKDHGSIFYTADCEVFKNGNYISPDELKAGDAVQLILDKSQYAVYINAREQDDGQKYSGVVNSILTIDGQYWLGLVCDDGQEITRPVADGVKVDKTGGRADVSALIKGEYIEVQILNNKITAINLLASPTILRGVINELNSRGTPGITIRDDAGKNVKCVVAGIVAVERDGYDIDFDDLEIGELVRLELNSKGLVSRIKVLESVTSQVEGEIRDLTVRGTLRITLRDDEGEDVRYIVLDDVDVVRDSRDIDFNDLDIGEWARLKLNSKDRVYYIEVIEKYSAIEGAVNDLITDGSQKMIRIRKSNGSRMQYNLARNAEYYREGKSISLSDIVIGAEVKIRVNDDNYVTRIEITNDQDITLAGTVIYVSEGDNKIKIEQVSGNRFTYSFVRVPLLEDKRGDKIKLRDIDDDAEVAIVLQNGKVSSLTVHD